MSGKWHVASSLTQADRHLAAAARLRRVLRHDHRRRQLLRPEHADPRQREHRARGARADGFFYTDAISDQAVELHRARTRSEHPEHAVLRVRRLHRAALAAARARRGHRQVRGPLRRRLGRAARGAARQARRLGPARRALEADRARPDAAAVDRGRARRAVPRLDAALHGGLRGADRPHGPGHRPHPRRAREAPASSTTRWSSSSPTTAPAPRTFREDVTIDELVDKLMIARRTTRSGEPVHFGNDIDAHARARRTPTRATAPPGPTSRTRRSASTSTGSTRAASRRR